MACRLDPASVETQVCGEAAFIRYARTMAWDINLHVVKAACSVACLERYWWISVFSGDTAWAHALSLGD